MSTDGTDGTPAERPPERAEPTGRESAGAGAGASGASPELARLAAAVKAIERREPADGPPAASAPPRPRAEAPAPAPATPPPAAAPAAVPAPSTPLPQEPSAAARAVLARGGAPETLAEPAVEALGERAGELLAEDPWLVLSLAGVRPDQADGFARALLGDACGPGDERRGRAVTGWLMHRAADAGHTALEWSVLLEALRGQSVPDAEDALRRAVEEGQVMVFQDEPEGEGRGPASDDEDAPVTVLLALDRYALAEESLADGLVRLLNTFETESDEQADAERPLGTEDGTDAAEDDAAADDDGAEADPVAVRVRADWAAIEAAAPSPSAAALVRAVAGSGLVTHSGGEAARAEPAALVAAARAAGLRAFAAAHTEDGRRRLAELLGAGAEGAAVTVDGLLSGAEGPGRGHDGALELDLLAVLDAPQLDVERAATLVEAVPDGARLVLGGDPAVLWSAGPGRAFADLLAAKVCPQVVSRTPDPGPVGDLVSGIAIGELEPVEAPGKEVVIVPVREPAEAVHRTVQLMADSVPRAIGVPVERTQVVTPGHGGPAGTRALNAALKERLNPGPGRFAGFDPGDRVVYAPGPGRAVSGTVVSGDAEGLRLDCGGTAVVVPPERVRAALRHGWAITAHQAVGTCWPAVVVVLPGDAASSLTRGWVYTAFSRAQRHLSVVQGVDQALARAVREVPAKERTTRLRAVLREQTADAEPVPQA
ncbi:ATP-binding domain-containing protein [Streptomyces sp. PTM05]|uniref:ATP-binding domain-containing protein n=1 Tax=Streptantibioticus parmotrematis TaxID=2873249 RepID=A0ABS7QMM2_9ACTN|nr:ATP-binding domain-containing protein [Streptantibioticus parmotrematis]MBY8884441.1 ATP-binding domain-containing protein [Streptantibioticus parmotrematis]